LDWERVGNGEGPTPTGTYPGCLGNAGQNVGGSTTRLANRTIAIANVVRQAVRTILAGYVDFVDKKINDLAWVIIGIHLDAFVVPNTQVVEKLISVASTANTINDVDQYAIVIKIGIDCITNFVGVV
jgi:hypothetical protein